MYTGTFIFDFNMETQAVIDLLTQLKGQNRLFFALTEYERGDLEYALGYTIGNKIVADTKEEESYELLRTRAALQWFEPKTELEMIQCIESNGLFYAGCVVKEGYPLNEALFTFEFLENLTVGSDIESALFIGSEESKTVKTFMLGLEGFVSVLPPESDDRIWLPEGSAYIDKY